MPARLKRECVQAVMIDMQERILPAMEHREEVTEKSRMLLRGLRLLDVPVIRTQQYTKGLGMTQEDLAEAAGTGAQDYVEKITFDCLRTPAFCEVLDAAPERSQILVFGVETHVCVQATVLSLLDRGAEVFVVCDCVDSRRSSDRETALRRMEQAGAVLTTAEAVLFELIDRAGTPEFKQISRLVK